MSKFLRILAMTAAMLSAAPTVLAAASTDDVWQRHITDWTERDLDGIVSDYADDAVVIVVDRIYRGKSEIRTLFSWLFRTFDRATVHNIDPALVDGRIVYITWNAEIDGLSHPFGTDTFVIEGGRIVYQTITTDRQFFQHP